MPLTWLLYLSLASGLSVPPGAERRDVVQGALLASVALVQPAAAKSRDDPIYTVRRTDAEWKALLSRPQYAILRQGGTERPNSSRLTYEKREGLFLCAGCGTELFSSSEKFNSGTGWPSFAAATANVEIEAVAFEAFTGAELRCKNCGGHLGDRFKDGQFFPGTRAAETGERYCIDGAALVFVPRGGGTPVSGDVGVLL